MKKGHLFINSTQHIFSQWLTGASYCCWCWKYSNKQNKTKNLSLKNLLSIVEKQSLVEAKEISKQSWGREAENVWGGSTIESG